jgi:hypothetical protein
MKSVIIPQIKPCVATVNYLQLPPGKYFFGQAISLICPRETRGAQRMRTYLELFFYILAISEIKMKDK